MSNYIVKVSRACMPNSCYGGMNYYRIGLLEVEHNVTSVAMISKRSRGVKRVVQTWEKLHKGKTTNSVFYETLKYAEELKTTLQQEM